MLTKSDFSQIRKIVREEVETESDSLKRDLEGEIKLARMELQGEIHTLVGKVKDSEISLRKIQKDIKTIVNFFDNEYLRLQKEVYRIKEHLHLPLIA